MDLDDLFNRDHRRSKHVHRDYEKNHGHLGGRHREYDHDSDDRDHHEWNDRWRDHGEHSYRHHNDDVFDLSRLTHRLLANKKLLIPAGIVFLAAIVVAAILVLPLFGQALDFITESGLQGVIDQLLHGTGGVK
jgi:hypothetical protein